jgi:hypothetical protein
MADTIDINVYETTEDVTINVTPNVIEVNINKVTSISPVTSVNGQTGDVTIAVSDNNFTDALETKLNGIQANAEVNVNADWNATTGDAQILNKPSIPASQINSDWNATSGVAQILNKPSLTGFGDMLKSTYDTDNTGVVDNAEAIKIIGRNSTGSILYRGTVVYLNGATGNRPNFAKAQANSESTSAGTFGIIVDDLANNSDGYCIALGYLDNLDTRTNATNPFTIDTLSAGDTLYLSPTNAGYITNQKPSAPNHLVYLGKVTRTGPANGTIVYRIQNGYELEELHNVAISSVANEDFIRYETSTSLWKNVQITSSWLLSKLGISTLSGSNTGDETQSSILSKLGYTPIKSVIKDTVQSSTITGTTAETLTGTYLIPANTFSANDIMKITSFLAEKTGVSGTCTMRVKTGTTNVFSSATTIATYVTVLSEPWCVMQRSSITLRGGNLRTLSPGVSRQNDIAATSSAATIITFNPAVNNYIFTSLQLSVSTDSMFQSNFIMTN